MSKDIILMKYCLHLVLTVEQLIVMVKVFEYILIKIHVNSYRIMCYCRYAENRLTDSLFRLHIVLSRKMY